MKTAYLEIFVSWIMQQSIEVKKQYGMEKWQFKITKDGIKYAVVED